MELSMATAGQVCRVSMALSTYQKPYSCLDYYKEIFISKRVAVSQIDGEVYSNTFWLSHPE